MKKDYEVTKDFWVGESNTQLRKGTKVGYDDVTGTLMVEGKNYSARNLKAAIKAQWLVPVDGSYPELDGPVGETEEQKSDRKRKERFAQQAAKNKEVKGLVKDESQVGVLSEDSEAFKNILNAEPVASAKIVSTKAKKNMSIIEDDTKEIGKATLDRSEPKAMKKALGQDKEKKETGFEVFLDHYDADTKHVGKYVSTEGEQETIQAWGKMHWTKKADIIKNAKDKTLLTQLHGLETSKKIKERIAEKLESL